MICPICDGKIRVIEKEIPNDYGFGNIGYFYYCDSLTNSIHADFELDFTNYGNCKRITKVGSFMLKHRLTGNEYDLYYQGDSWVEILYIGDEKSNDELIFHGQVASVDIKSLFALIKRHHNLLVFK